MASKNYSRKWITGTVIAANPEKGYVTLVENETGAKVVLGSKGGERSWVSRIAGKREGLEKGATVAAYGLIKAGKSDDFYMSEHGVLLASPGDNATIHLTPAVVEVNKSKDGKDYLQVQYMDDDCKQLPTFASVPDVAIDLLGSKPDAGLAARRGVLLRVVSQSDHNDGKTFTYRVFGNDHESPEKTWQKATAAKDHKGQPRLRKWLEGHRTALGSGQARLEAVGFTSAFVNCPPEYAASLSHRDNFTVTDAGGRSRPTYSLAAVVVRERRGKREVSKVQPLPKAQIEQNLAAVLGNQIPGVEMKTFVETRLEPVPGATLTPAVTNPNPVKTANADAVIAAEAPPVGGDQAYPLSLVERPNARTRQVDSFTVTGSPEALDRYADRIAVSVQRATPMRVPAGFNFPISFKAAVGASLSDLLGTPPLYATALKGKRTEGLLVKGRLEDAAVKEAATKLGNTEPRWVEAFQGFVYPLAEIQMVSSNIEKLAPLSDAPPDAPAPREIATPSENPTPIAATPPPEPTPSQPPEAVAPKTSPSPTKAAAASGPNRIRYGQWMEAEFGMNPMLVVDRYAHEIAAEAEAAGIDAGHALGNLRFSGNGDTAPKVRCKPMNRKDSGSVMMFPMWRTTRDKHGDEVLAVRVTFKNMKSHRDEKFVFDAGNLMWADFMASRDIEPSADHQAQKEKERQEREVRAQEREAAAKAAAQEEAKARWRKLSEWQSTFAGLPRADALSPYLERKQISDVLEMTSASGAPAIDLRTGVDPDHGRYIIAPLVDMNGHFRGAQQIFENPKLELGKKTVEGSMFLDKDDNPTGAHIRCGELKDGETIYVAEGIADIAAAYKASNGIAAVGATGTANIGRVVRALKGSFPNSRIIIVADNDFHNPGKGNPGKYAALTAAFREGVEYLAPLFTGLDLATKPTDINDLMVLGGVERARAALQNPEQPPQSLLSYASQALAVIKDKRIATALEDLTRELSEAPSPPDDPDVIRKLLLESLSKSRPDETLKQTLDENDYRIVQELRPQRTQEPEPEPKEAVMAEEAKQSNWPVTIVKKHQPDKGDYVKIACSPDRPDLKQRVDASIRRISSSAIPFNESSQAWYLPAPLEKRLRSHLHDLTGDAPLYIGRTKGTPFVMGDFSNTELRQQVSNLLRYATITYVDRVGGFKVEHEPELPFIEASLGSLMRPTQEIPEIELDEDAAPPIDPYMKRIEAVFGVRAKDVARHRVKMNYCPEYGVITADDTGFVGAYTLAHQRTEGVTDDRAQRHRMCMDLAIEIIETKLESATNRAQLGENGTKRLREIVGHLNVFYQLNDPEPGEEVASVKEASIQSVAERMSIIAEDLAAVLEQYQSFEGRHATPETPPGSLKTIGSGTTAHVDILRHIDPAELLAEHSYSEGRVSALVEQARSQSVNGVWTPEADVHAYVRADNEIVCEDPNLLEAAKRAEVKLAAWVNPMVATTNSGMKARDLGYAFRKSALAALSPSVAPDIDPEAVKIASSFKDSRAIDDELPLNPSAEARIDRMMALVAFGAQNFLTPEEIYQDLIVSTASPYYDATSESKLSTQLTRDLRYINMSSRYPHWKTARTAIDVINPIEDTVGLARFKQLKEHVRFYLIENPAERGENIKSFRKAWREPERFGALPENAPLNPYGTEDFSENEALKEDIRRYTLHEDGSFEKFFDGLVEEFIPDLQEDMFAMPTEEPEALEEVEPEFLHTLVDSSEDGINKSSMHAYRVSGRTLYENRYETLISGGARDTRFQSFSMSLGAAEQINDYLQRGDLATAEDMKERLGAQLDVLRRDSINRYNTNLLVEASMPGEESFFLTIESAAAEDGTEITTLNVAGTAPEATVDYERRMAIAPTPVARPQVDKKSQVAAVMAQLIKKGTAPEIAQQELARSLGLSPASRRITNMMTIYNKSLKTANLAAYQEMVAESASPIIQKLRTGGVATMEGSPAEKLRDTVMLYVREEAPYSQFYSDLFKGEEHHVLNPFYSQKLGGLDRKALTQTLTDQGFGQLRDLYETRFHAVHGRASNELNLSRQGGFIPSSVDVRAPLSGQFSKLIEQQDAVSTAQLDQSGFASFVSQNEDPTAMVGARILAEDLASVTPEYLAENYSEDSLYFLADVNGIHVAINKDDPDVTQQLAEEIINQWQAREDLLDLEMKDVEMLDRETLETLAEDLGLSTYGSKPEIISRLNLNATRLRDLSRIRTYEYAFVASALNAEANGVDLSDAVRKDLSEITAGSEDYRKLLQTKAEDIAALTRLNDARQALTLLQKAAAASEIHKDWRDSAPTLVNAPAEVERAYVDWSRGELSTAAQLKNVYGSMGEVNANALALPSHISYHGTYGSRVVATPACLTNHMLSTYDLAPLSESAKDHAAEPITTLLQNEGKLVFKASVSDDLSVITSAENGKATVHTYNDGELIGTKSIKNLGSFFAQSAASLGSVMGADEYIADYVAELGKDSEVTQRIEAVMRHIDSVNEDQLTQIVNDAENVALLERTYLRTQGQSATVQAEALLAEALSQARIATMPGSDTLIDKEPLAQLEDYVRNLPEAVVDAAIEQTTTLPWWAKTKEVAMQAISAARRDPGDADPDVVEAVELVLPGRGPLEVQINAEVAEGQYSSVEAYVHQQILTNLASGGSSLALEVIEREYPSLDTADMTTASTPPSLASGDYVYAEVNCQSVLGTLCKRSDGSWSIAPGKPLAQLGDISEEDYRWLHAPDGEAVYGLTYEEYAKTLVARLAPGEHFKVQPSSESGIEQIKKMPLAELTELAHYMGVDADAPRLEVAEAYISKWHATHMFVGMTAEEIDAEFDDEEIKWGLSTLGSSGANGSEELAALAEESFVAANNRAMTMNFEKTQEVASKYSLPISGSTPNPAVLVTPGETPIVALTSASRPAVYASQYEGLREIVEAGERGRTLRSRAVATCVLENALPDGDKSVELLKTLSPDLDVAPVIEDGVLKWQVTERDSPIGLGQFNTASEALVQLMSTSSDRVIDPVAFTLNESQELAWVISEDSVSLHTGTAPTDMAVRRSEIESMAPIKILGEKGLVEVPASDVVAVDAATIDEEVTKVAQLEKGPIDALLDRFTTLASTQVENDLYAEAAQSLLAKRAVLSTLSELTAISRESGQPLELEVVGGRFHVTGEGLNGNLSFDSIGTLPGRVQAALMSDTDRTIQQVAAPAKRVELEEDISEDGKTVPAIGM